MDLYARQRRYFELAYQTGEHGWPTVEPTPFVLRSLQKLMQKRDLLPSDRVLDLGCGEGRHTIACAERGLFAVGLDYQPLAIARARRMPKVKKLRRDIRFLVGDAFSLPFKPASFRLVIDFGCFHHIRKKDTPRYLKSLLPLLIPGGYFILSCFSWRFRHYPGERRKRDWLVHRGHYDRFFRKPDFDDTFGEWFEIVKIEEERDGLYAFYLVLMQRRS
jgi:SAM-dependent methyltransferase